MNETPHTIREWHQVDASLFENEIVTQYQPAILRGLVKNWPIVQQAERSPEAVCHYLRALDNGTDVDAITVPFAEKGCIFYRDDLSSFNFSRERMPVSKVLERILNYAKAAQPDSIAAQSALTPYCLPKFAIENQLPLLSGAVMPRIWIGNSIITPAHIDESHNIACVVTGKRRFTLFPPEQAPNLYLGPIDFNPTGSPISMVSLKNPDFERYPKFREALAAAYVADLEPGDALFIPAVWWHHVESIEKVNVLVNYWWKSAAGSPFASLMHCALNMNDLSPELKAAWGAVFNHFIFNAGTHPLEHIPEHKRGVLGNPPPELVKQLKAWLSGMLR
jgi:hypothetical protein